MTDKTTIAIDAWIVVWHQCNVCHWQWNRQDRWAESFEDIVHDTECPRCALREIVQNGS